MKIDGKAGGWNKLSPEAKRESLRKAKVMAQSSCQHNSTNSEFATNNGKFRNDCEEAGIIPSRRQASKYRRKIGLARST